MDNKCAWCQIDTDKQLSVKADIVEDGKCPVCGSYNDIGQRTIHINSMKQIYNGAVRLLQHITHRFTYLTEYAGIDWESIAEDFDYEEGQPVSVNISTDEIIGMLFLSDTGNAGSTSTGNLRGLLGVKEHSQEFVIWEGSEEE